MVHIPDIPGPAQYIAPSLEEIRKIIRPVTAMVSQLFDSDTFISNPCSSIDRENI